MPELRNPGEIEASGAASAGTELGFTEYWPWPPGTNPQSQSLLTPPATTVAPTAGVRGGALLNDLPESWLNFLAGKTSVQSAQTEQGSTGGNLAPGADSQRSRTDEQVKLQRVREKNKRAMQKFRNKQKEKAEQTEARMQELSQLVEDMQLEIEQLRAEKLHLTIESDSKRAENGNHLAAEEEDAGEWEPQHGWTDFNPKATIVLRAMRRDNQQPLRVTRADFLSMSTDLMYELFGTFTAVAAPLLVAADDDPDSEAGKRLQGMKLEIHAFVSQLTVVNPTVDKDFSGLPPPTPEERVVIAKRMVRAMKLSPAQAAQLRRIYDLITADILQLRKERGVIMEELRAAQELGLGNPVGYDFVPVVECLRKLLKNTEEVHRCQCSFCAACWGSTLNAFQVAKAVVVCFPRGCDMWSAAASIEPPSGQDANTLVDRQVALRYRELWSIKDKQAQQQMIEDLQAKQGDIVSMQAFEDNLSRALPANIPANHFAPDLLV